MKYQPSNGTEGMEFIEDHCMNCLHCNPDPEGEKQCEILMRSMVYSAEQPEYPSEWTYDEKDKPTCTSWQKWDWGNDGDPDEPDNPKAPPPPPDPNQLAMFPLYPDELDFSELKMEDWEMRQYRTKIVSGPYVPFLKLIIKKTP